MMQILGNMLLSLVGRYGYLAVLFGVALKSTGIPVPGDALFWVGRKGDRVLYRGAIRGPTDRSS